MTEYQRYTFEELDQMETRHSGQFSNLKVETTEFRQWLDRQDISRYRPALQGTRHGLKPSRLVIVDAIVNGNWKTIDCYIAEGEPDGCDINRQFILKQQMDKSGISQIQESDRPPVIKQVWLKGSPRHDYSHFWNIVQEGGRYAYVDAVTFERIEECRRSFADLESAEGWLERYSDRVEHFYTYELRDPVEQQEVDDVE